jgi:hypothetical protein
MKTKLLFTALAMTVGSLSAQTYYQITNITGSGNSDTVWARGPNQLVPALVVTADCAQTIVTMDSSYQVHITQNDFTVNPASYMGGFMIGSPTACNTTIPIDRRTYTMVTPGSNIPGVGSEMKAFWLASPVPGGTVLLPYNLHKQIETTCDGLVYNIGPISGPYPC